MNNIIDRFLNTSFRVKLLGGFLAVAVMVGAVSAYQVVRQIGLNSLQQKGIKRADDLLKLKDVGMRVEGIYAVFGDAVINRDLDQTKKDFDQIKKDYEKDLATIKELVDTPEERAWLGEFAEHYKRYLDLFEKQMLPSLETGRDFNEISRIDGEIDGARSAALDVLLKINKSLENEYREADELYDKVSARSVVVAAVLVVFSFAMSVLLALFLTRTLTGQLGGDPAYLADVSRRIASGDLTVKFNGGNSGRRNVASEMKVMADNLKGIIRGINETTDTVSASSERLSSTVTRINKRMDEQAAKTGQVATASAQMSQTVTDIAKNAANIATSATETARVAQSGEGVVSKTVDEVREIARTVSESAQLMSSLGERSKQIGEILRVIKDIADQTNLLALNAAIEAARAGEQGRGFAVVADEVRKLAERTAKATTEIGDMIHAIREETGRAVTAMDEGSERVNAGVSLAQEAGDALQKIVRSVDGLQSMVQQIASATEQMSTVSGQINLDLEFIASVSRETSEGSEEIVQASADLGRRSSDLKAVIGRFRL